MIKILFVPIGGEAYTAARDRIYIYKEEWKKYDIEGEYASLHSKNHVLSNNLFSFLHSNYLKYDIIYVFRGFLPISLLKKIYASKTKLLFDFDDAIYHVPSSQCAELFSEVNSLNEKIKQVYRYITRGNKFYSVRHKLLKKTLIYYDSVIAGNNVLYDYASKYVNDVFISPTPIDCQNISSKNHISKNKLTIGWTGVPNNLIYLKLLNPTFKLLSAKFKNKIELMIVSELREIKIEGINVNFVTWKKEIDKSILNHFDIGIMPLTADGWSEGKCSFKALLMMAAGLPIIISPVGMNKTIIQEGITGYSAKTQNEWVEKFSKLIESDSLRKDMGKNAREFVVNNYSKDVLQAKLAKHLHNIVMK
jgi:glycosyltransferase involved in cell wall biosynthesis